MTTINTILKSVAPDAVDPDRHVVDADLARGRAALVTARHRRARARLASGVGALAAAGAAAVVVTSGGGTVASPAGIDAHRGQAAAQVTPTAAGAPLIRLANYVDTSDAPTGNATVVARTTKTGGSDVTVYDLYADNGEYFYSPTEDGLADQVNQDNNRAGGLFARELAAARLAATGDVRTAAQDMADAPLPNHVLDPNAKVDQAANEATRKKLGQQASVQTGNLYDNYAWEDSQDALIAGAGQPEIRAGVLKILATLPGVTVTQGTTNGTPTLVISSGSQETLSGYTETLTINADNGVPIAFTGGPTNGTPETTVTYQVTRKTFAGLPSSGGNTTTT